ncbi:MAG TPA: 50S ribosomal protein L15 [Candidatus Syntrophoarchaeum butanivorans]|uniref:Large ribosomal subunit protein uL15 n=1 Tax=Candidatus Syntropharchaeum butanivorans TaxID=1839936 RepID=A0A7C1AV76_9EURY|nr:MAG: 50S ribosomal protein L15 [Candidatus Syntrophoarchaeum sp. WYZ-LMO15]HDM36188.1 50S ribosomal protein L15 [Candidatus Syntrophoarchaeum butanivorans]HEC57118.1 50S ribosomal protein L15 [Candidatus Syntrophoarchaeum butanivorans]
MKKKVSKYRGSRTCGGGTHKNRRGAGNRGGRGRAGMDDHNFVHYYKRGITVGKHGFKRPRAVIEDVKTINVGVLDEMADDLLDTGVAEVVEGKIQIDLTKLGIEKVLGSGRVTKPLQIQGGEVSARAREKIESAGGLVIFHE